jgi:hypothetical protein
MAIRNIEKLIAVLIMRDAGIITITSVGKKNQMLSSYATRPEAKISHARISNDTPSSLHPEEPCPSTLRDASLLRVKGKVVTKDK